MFRNKYFSSLLAMCCSSILFTRLFSACKIATISETNHFSIHTTAHSTDISFSRVIRVILDKDKKWTLPKLLSYNADDGRYDIRTLKTKFDSCFNSSLTIIPYANAVEGLEYRIFAEARCWHLRRNFNEPFRAHVSPASFLFMKVIDSRCLRSM